MATERIEFPAVDEPTVSILIVGWRDAPLLTACLRSLLDGCTGVPAEVLIALNEPTARLVTEVERVVVGARVVRFRANLGFAGAVNHLAHLARGEFLVLLNDDCVVEAGWAAHLVDTARRRPQCGLVGSTFLHPDGTLQEAGSILWSTGLTWAVGDGQPDNQLDFERRVDYCSGGSLLVRRHVWQSLGGLDDCYYPAYYEDVDLCLRAAAAGWTTWYQPASKVRHVRSASTEAGHRRFVATTTGAVFATRWQELLAGKHETGAVEAAIWEARGRPVRVLVVDDRMPDRRVGSGFGRMADTLSALGADDGLAVSFHAVNGDATAPADFARLGIRTVVDLRSHLVQPGVVYDVVVLSRPHNALALLPLVRECQPAAKIVYDAEAMYYRRLEMQAALAATQAEGDALRRAARATRLDEEHVLRQADVVVCISDEEAALAQRRTSAPVEVVSPWFAAVGPTPADFGQRCDIGFTAGWLAGPGAPNSDALLWFAKQVLPLVRARVPGTRLLVTGGSPPVDVSWLAGPAVRFVGSVPDLSTFYNGIRVAVSPTRFGAGVKLKTVEAIQHGVPVVTTREAANGLPPATRRALTVTDDPRRFADAVVALLTDPAAWERYRAGMLAALVPEQRTSTGIGHWPAIARGLVTADASPSAFTDRGSTRAS